MRKYIILALILIQAFLFYALGYNNALDRVERYVDNYWDNKWEEIK